MRSDRAVCGSSGIVILTNNRSRLDYTEDAVTVPNATAAKYVGRGSIFADLI